jgi:hypothetical protein
MERRDARSWLYEGAHHHVADWEAGRLEERSAVAYSSQALCVSVFGALDRHPQAAAIVQASGDAAGVALPAEEPSIVCEDRSHPEVLNEKGGRSILTSPDVLVRWPNCILSIESKFREELGPCGQTESRQAKSRGKEPAACTGDHAPGSDRKTRTDAACRLTIWDGKREPRRYWHVAERLFLAEALAVPRRPCPFASGTYQLMRNLTFAAEFARLNALPQFAFLVAYVAASPSAGHTQELARQFAAMLVPEVRDRFGLVSYETIRMVAASQRETKLADWIDARIPDLVPAIRAVPTTVRVPEGTPRRTAGDHRRAASRSSWQLAHTRTTFAST